jgi:hypothetical protein
VCAQDDVVTLQGNLVVYPKDMGNMDYAEALEVCEKLNESKSFHFDDWRLPTLSELKILTSSGGKVKNILPRKRYGSLEGILDLKDNIVDRNLDWKSRLFNFRPVRTDNVPEVSAEPTELTVSPFEVNYQQEGGSQLMMVITNADSWKIKSYPDWCSISSQTSTTFVLTGNANSGDKRTDELIISADDKEVKTNIIQKGVAVQTQTSKVTYTTVPQNVVVEEKIKTPLSKSEWRNIIVKDMATGITKSNPAGDYKGQTVRNTRNGLGIFLWSDSTLYLGHWDGSFGMKNGVGMYIPPVGYETDYCDNCNYFVGNWNDDKRSGQGNCYDINGNLIYKGGFTQDRPTDVYPSTTDYSAYKFEYLSLPDGNSYVGETFNNQPEGVGVLLRTNGDIGLGTWKEGKKQLKQGVTITLDGKITQE